MKNGGLRRLRRQRRLLRLLTKRSTDLPLGYAERGLLCVLLLLGASANRRRGRRAFLWRQVRSASSSKAQKQSPRLHKPSRVEPSQAESSRIKPSQAERLLCPLGPLVPALPLPLPLPLPLSLSLQKQRLHKTSRLKPSRAERRRQLAMPTSKQIVFMSVLVAHWF